MYQQTNRRLPTAAFVMALMLIAHWIGTSPNAQALANDQQQPIRITADKALRDDKKGVTVYTGNVQMQQGSLQIAANTITISDSEGQARKIVAAGKPAKLQQQPAPEQAMLYAQAHQIEYDNDTGKVRFHHQARIEQDGSKVTGDTIDYDINQQIVKADSGNKTGTDRVEVVIPPQLINNPAETGSGNSDG